MASMIHYKPRCTNCGASGWSGVEVNSSFIPVSIDCEDCSGIHGFGAKGFAITYKRRADMQPGDWPELDKCSLSGSCDGSCEVS